MIPCLNTGIQILLPNLFPIPVVDYVWKNETIIQVRAKNNAGGGLK